MKKKIGFSEPVPDHRAVFIGAIWFRKKKLSQELARIQQVVFSLPFPGYGLRRAHDNTDMRSQKILKTFKWKRVDFIIIFHRH